MRHKGYIARHHYVMDAGVYVGEIINAPDVIAFSAVTLTQLHAVMVEAVESYLLYWESETVQETVLSGG